MFKNIKKRDGRVVEFVTYQERILELDPDDVVKWAGGNIAVIDCFGILSDDKIRRYFELGCEVKALGRGHLKRIKEEVKERVKK